MGILDFFLGDRDKKRYKCPVCKKAYVTLDMERCPNCGTHIDSMVVKKCPKCGELNNIKAKFCKKCGFDFEAYEVSKSKYRCPRCGYEMDTLMTRCPACGVKFL